MSKKNSRKLSNQTSRSTSAPAAAAAKVGEFNPDYTNTKRELRRIAILATSFIVILVILSFFQNQILALFTK